MKAHAKWLFNFLVLGLALNAAAAQPREEPVTLDTPTGKLAGTLQVPASAGKVPVALIIAGSGPTNRDGNITVMPGHNNSLKMLAQALADAGVASLRYDKRGIGESMSAAPNEADLRFDTYVDDAVAWADKLKADTRFGTLVVIGHSEGSLIGMTAAQRANAGAFISLSGAGQSAPGMLRKQFAANAPALAADAQRILASLERGQLVADVPPALMAAFRPSVQPYMISWFRYTPAERIAALKMPVLIAQGETDIQVSVEDARALKSAKPDAVLAIIPGMNHVLKLVPADQGKQIASYTDPALPLAPQLVAAITDFLRKMSPGAN